MTAQQIPEPLEIDWPGQGINPFKLLRYPTLASTNTEAAVLLQNKLIPPPFIVFTNHQTAGRGRGTNTWVSTNGVLTVTFVVTSDHLRLPQYVPLLAGLAIRDACVSLGAKPVGLKWPNDVLANGLKVAGLLCERVYGGDLIGVGANVSNHLRDLPTSIARRSTTISTLAGREVSTSEAIQAFTKSIASYFIEPKQTLEQAMESYSNHLAMKGRKIRVSDPGLVKSIDNVEGYCDGVDDSGRLVVTNSLGRHVIMSGSVKILD